MSLVVSLVVPVTAVVAVVSVKPANPVTRMIGHTRKTRRRGSLVPANPVVSLVVLVKLVAVVKLAAMKPVASGGMIPAPAASQQWAALWEDVAVYF